MFISSSYSFCYKKALFARDTASSVKSTAQSFKSWDTCMDNKVCKIVAIVGIVFGVLIVFWVLSTLIRCVCLGFQCIEACCCCCGRSSGSRGQTVIVQAPNQDSAYGNPNMYPPTYAPTFYPNPQRDASGGGTAPPQQAYFTNRQGYESVYTPHNNAGSKYNDRPMYTDEIEKYDNNTAYRGY